MAANKAVCSWGCPVTPELKPSTLTPIPQGIVNMPLHRHTVAGTRAA